MKNSNIEMDLLEQILEQILEFEYVFHTEYSGRQLKTKDQDPPGVRIEPIGEDEKFIYSNTTFTFIEGDAEVYYEVQYPKILFYE
jgi:hypothetical protein